MTSFHTARTHHLTRACALGATTALLLMTAACGGNDKSNTAAATPVPVTVTGTLNAASQTGDGKSVTIKKVTITGSGGWIALHKDNKGAPGAVAGFVEIPEGTSTNVKVKGDKTLATGAYWPMLHKDDGTLDTYEFGETTAGYDAPVMADGKPVMKKITYTKK